MSDIIYRTAGAWGGGQGSDLAAAQVDMNFWMLYSLISRCKNAAPAITISYFTVTGNQMWITMSDHYVFGPFTIPPPCGISGVRGDPNSAYTINDVFTVKAVRFTSASTRK